MKKALMFFACLLLMCSFGYGGTVKRTFYSDGLCFYLIHPGGDLTLDLKIYQFKPGYRGMPQLNNTPAAVITLYNPAEDLVQKHYWQKSAEAPESRLPISIKDAPAGVWQLRSSFATNCNLALDLTMSESMKYGLLFSRCKILPEDLPHLRSNYFLVPPYRKNYRLNIGEKAPGQNKLYLSNRGHNLRLRDPQKREWGTCDIYDLVGAMPDIFGNANIDLPRGFTEEHIPVIGGTMILSDENKRNIALLEAGSNMIVPVETGKIYHLGYRGTTPGNLSLDGFPVILCQDIATAKAINCSTVPGPDGKVFSWKYQVQIYKWLRSLKPEDLKVDIVPLDSYKQAFLKHDPQVAFLPLFANLENLLKAQQCDPKAPDFGQSKHIGMEFLFWLYTFNRPFNPYYHNQAVLNRFLAFYLPKWLEVTEAGVMFDDPGEGPYCGGLEWVGWETMALPSDYALLPIVSETADPDLMKNLAFGMALPLHRFFSCRLACENQSMHMPLKLYGMYKMTGDSFYQKLAHSYMKDYADPQLSHWMKTGYPVESYGLDGTYTGITTSMLAFTMRLFNDYTGLSALRRTYNLMNHTVVPEPDGTLSAAAGFAHRTQGTWIQRQYGGGTFLLRDKLEEAAALHRHDQPRHFTRKEAEDIFQRSLKQTAPPNLDVWLKTAGRNLTLYAVSAFSNQWSYGYFGINHSVPEPKLPVEQEDCFSKNFNDEFIAERRPAYYAFMTTLTQSWRRRNDRESARLYAPLVKEVNGELKGGNVSRTWLPVQGMEIFWTPQFGIFLAARNWSLFTHSLTRLEQNGKVTNFPTSYETDMDIKPGKTTFNQPGKMGNVTFHRTITTLDQGVNLDLTVDTMAPQAPGCLIEQLPYLIKKDLKFHGLQNGKKVSLPAQNLTDLYVTRDNGSSIRLHFSAPVDIRQGIRSVSMYDSNEKIGLLEITFDKNFTTTSAFSYQILNHDN